MNSGEVLPSSHCWGRQERFGLFLLPSSLFLRREEHSGNLHLFSKGSWQAPVRLSAGSGGCSGQGGGGTPFARHPASLRGPVEHPTNRDLRGPRSAHSGPSQRLRRHLAPEASFLRRITCIRRAPPHSRARGWARPPLPLASARTPFAHLFPLLSFCSHSFNTLFEEPWK